MALYTERIFTYLRSLRNRGTRDLRLLALATFCMSFCFGGLMATFNNFAVKDLHLMPQYLGILEAFRESPGFIIVLVAALTMTVSEPALASIALILFGLGIAAYKYVDSFTLLVVYSMFWSTGLHSWMTLQPSMALNLASRNAKGRRLGQLGAVGAFGIICGMLMVFGLGDRIGFRNIFLIAGIASIIGGVLVSLISKNIGHAEKPRLVFKRRYTLYYILTFLEGCRKQIFLTFAVYAMVRNYGTPLRVVALLMIINNVMNVLLTPWIGRLIDRIGERKVLAFCYAAVIPVFLGYALIKIPVVLYLMYCLDNLFYIGSIASTTYLHKIANPEDVMPSIAMGVSVNHAAAVAVPLVGAFLWTRFNYPATFFGGAFVAAISVLTVLQMKLPKQQLESHESVAVTSV